MGMHFVACAPEKYFPDAALIAECQAIAMETGATLEFQTDPAKAVQGADEMCIRDSAICICIKSRYLQICP